MRQTGRGAGLRIGLGGRGHGGDQFAILTACAVATNRIKLGTSITSVFVRTAPTIAMAAATVDHFSNGRFILGLGSSHKVQVEPEHGLEFNRPIERMRECTGIVRGILRDGDVNYRGDVYNIERFDLWFEPVRRCMPIYYAAVRPRMLEISGELSDGVILTWCTLDHAALASKHVAIGAERAGRDPADVDVTTLIACAVSDDRDVARDELRRYVATYIQRFPRYRRLGRRGGIPRRSPSDDASLAGGTAGRSPRHGPGGTGGHRSPGRLPGRVPRATPDVSGSRYQDAHSLPSRLRPQREGAGHGSHPRLRPGTVEPSLLKALLGWDALPCCLRAIARGGLVTVIRHPPTFHSYV